MILLLVLLSASCRWQGSDEYSTLNEDLSYRLVSIGEERSQAENGDYLSVEFIYKTFTDSVFYSGRSKFRFNHKVASSTIGPVLQMLSSGDSACLIVDVQNYFFNTLQTPVPGFLVNQKKMKIDIKILDIQTESEFENEKALFLSWVKEFYSTEAEKIRQFLDKEKLPLEHKPSGIYFFKMKNGDGPFVQKGRRIRIHYQGRFLNGYYIDDSYERNTPLDFIFGTEYVVIRGIEEALTEMRQGDKALVIVPSDMAFGSMGSAGGIVPPFTSLIYELEVLKVY